MYCIRIQCIYTWWFIFLTPPTARTNHHHTPPLNDPLLNDPPLNDPMNVFTPHPSKLNETMNLPLPVYNPTMNETPVLYTFRNNLPIPTFTTPLSPIFPCKFASITPPLKIWFLCPWSTKTFRIYVYRHRMFLISTTSLFRSFLSNKIIQNHQKSLKIMNIYENQGITVHYLSCLINDFVIKYIYISRILYSTNNMYNYMCFYSCDNTYLLI